MANVSFEGMDDMIRALDAAGKIDEIAPDMLNAGANVVKAEIEKSIRSSRYRISSYSNSVTKSKVNKGKGDPYISITANGTNEKGVRRAQVLFILNYGRHRGKHGTIQGDYFWTTATKRAAESAKDAMEAVLAQKLKEEGL